LQTFRAERAPDSFWRCSKVFQKNFIIHWVLLSALAVLSVKYDQSGPLHKIEGERSGHHCHTYIDFGRQGALPGFLDHRTTTEPLLHP
jgi:hypothetical protein